MIKKTKAKIRQQAAAQNPPKAYGINGKASHLLCHRTLTLYGLYSVSFWPVAFAACCLSLSFF
jgi:hypothetical protein